MEKEHSFHVYILFMPECRFLLYKTMFPKGVAICDPRDFN